MYTAVEKWTDLGGKPFSKDTAEKKRTELGQFNQNQGYRRQLAQFALALQMASNKKIAESMQCNIEMAQMPPGENEPSWGFGVLRE